MTDVLTKDTSKKGSVAAIILAIAGAGLMVWGFLAGIDAALTPGGTGSGPFQVIFFIGAALVLAAIVLAVVGLVRRTAVGLSLAALLLSLVPVIAVIVLAVRARG